MKYFKAWSLFFSIAVSALANDTFAPSSECKSCHPVIYNEFSASMHQKALPFQDPIHKAVWDKHPKNIKAQKYVCGKCHAPTADDLGGMLANDKKSVMPDMTNKTHREAISCAYCHRIEGIKHNKLSNTNLISKKEKHYFGRMKDVLKSDFHTVSSDNSNIQNGNVCMGCHSHKANKAGLNVCSTNENKEIDTANCVSCHMQQVNGAVSNLRETKTHAFHGFPGAHDHQDFLSKYIDIELYKKIDSFALSVYNKSPHALLLHPLRLAQLRTTIIRSGKKNPLKDVTFVRVIGADGKPTPPWLAKTVIKDTMIQGDEKRTVSYSQKLQKGDRLKVVLGYYLVNPKAVENLGLQNTPVAGKFFVLKSEVFDIQ